MRHLIPITLAAILFIPGIASAMDDSRALEGVSSAPIVYDVRTDAGKKLLFMFKVIEDTYDSMRTQGIKGEVVVSMRGPTVKMLVAGSQTEPPEVRKQIANRLTELAGKGIRLEACGYALNLFALDPTDLLPGVNAVGNSLVSLAGYQARGYALVPMN